MIIETSLFYLGYFSEYASRHGVQEPSKEIIGKGTMNHKDCYFQDNTRIQSINNIVCVNEDKTIMGKVIEDYNDRQLLKKIMMMPFVSTGGKRKTIKKIRK